MTQKEPGNVQAIMLQLDIEGANAEAKVTQYLLDGRTFLDEQLQKAGLDPTVNPTIRQISLIEDYAVGKYTLVNTQSHSDTLYLTARADIKTHVLSQISGKTEDEIATGTNQFKKSTGNVRDGFGI